MSFNREQRLLPNTLSQATKEKKDPHRRTHMAHIPVQAKEQLTLTDRNAPYYFYISLKAPLFRTYCLPPSIPLPCAPFPPPPLLLFRQPKNLQHNAQQQLIHRRMRKQNTHSPHYASCEWPRQRGTNIHNLQLLTRLHIPLHGHRVRHHDPAQLALVQHLDRIPRQYPVSDDSDDFARAVRHDCLSGFHERAAHVGHVVDEDHAGDFVGAGALFVDEGEAEVEAVGDGGYSLRTPASGLHNLQIRLDPPECTRLRIQIIDRHIEEALYLASMHIHRDDMIASGCLQHIGNELRRDRRPGFVFLVLPRVWEVRDDGCDAPSAGSFARVDHDEQLH